MKKIKISEIHKKIIFYILWAVFLTSLILLLLSSLSQLKTESEIRIKQIEDEISAIKVETANLQSRESDAKRYKELWSHLDERKKSTNGIKIDDINDSLKEMVDRYSIMSNEIKVDVPQVLKDGPFARKTVNLTFTTINLKFHAANDLKAVMFANDFINSFSGYVVVTAFEITKNKNYNRQDLIDISTGKGAGSIAGNLSFVWYTYKEVGASNDGKK